MVDEVRERIGASAATVLTEYRGLSVGDLQALRSSLREAGGTYKIYKNTLVRRAVAELDLDLGEMLVGPTALAFAETGDVVAVAKALRAYARDHDQLVLKGGLLGGDVLDAGQVTALAELPSREELLARLAGGLAAPTQNLANLLHNTMARFGWAVQALIDDQADGATADAA